MSDDDLFRLLLTILGLTFLPVAAYHRVKSTTDEKLDRRQEGIWLMIALRSSALPWLLSGLAWMINPSWMRWSAMPLPIWLRWCGFGLLGLWGLLLVWTFRNLGKNLTDTVVTRRDHTLVTSGPYRYVRHPFYLALFVAICGGTLVSANWFVLLSGLVPLSLLIARTRIEEEKLIERFGDEYRDYMNRTGRFFPRLGR